MTSMLSPLTFPRFVAPLRRCFRALARSASSMVWAAVLLPAAATMRGGEVVPLDEGWKFHLGDVSRAESPAFDANAWRAVELPHDWSIELPIDVTAPSRGGGGYFQNGIGWYRRTFTAPPAWNGQKVALEFDGVYMNADVWINGTHVATHPYGYTPFRCELTPYLTFNDANVLAVRVDNAQQPNSRWYSGAGINRHVRLTIRPPLHLAADSVFLRTKSLSGDTATVGYQGEITNDADRTESVDVEVTVFGPDRAQLSSRRFQVTIVPHGRSPIASEFTIAKPHPWSPATPVRYRAVTRLLQAERTLDEATTLFGIRTVRVTTANGFELNGQPMKLVGADAHSDNGPLGTAAFDRAEERRAELLKRAGFNAVRTAHNPPPPAFIDACDRLGLLVLEEVFDGWEKAKTPHDYSVAMKEWWQRDIDAMVRRDRNHPSVVLWSIGNEMYERGSERGLAIARELTHRIRELDPSRPITAGVNGPGKNGDWTKFDPLFATLDVAGYNYEISRHAADHARVPGRVIVVTESYQSETFANWAVVHDTPYVIGDFVWSGLDYLGEAGIGRVFAPGEPIVKHWEGEQWPWHGAACGDIDLIGDRKPISHYREIVWDRGEKLYAAVVVPSPNGQPWGVSPWTVTPTLASWTWPGEEGRPLRVEVYSRHEKVRVYLNEHLIGEQPTGRAQEFKAEFTVPYAPGTLKAVGVDGDREAEVFTLQTAQAPRKLRLTADRPVLLANGQDLVFVTVELTDEAGRVVPNADCAVNYDLSGPVSLAAVGNADLTSFETYQSNPHRTFQGRALVVLRSTHGRGVATLSASATGLAPAHVTVQSFVR